MKDKLRHEVILIFMLLFGVLAGLLDKDGLCIFFAITVAGDMIGTNIFNGLKDNNARPNQSKS